MTLGSETFDERLSRQLDIVEHRLHEVIVDENPFVTEAAGHLIGAGGKRFRPGLVLACADFGESADESRLISGAMVMELIHVASLYHDDVMDEAELRRGGPSGNAKYGNSIAILVGDYLFAKASSLVAELGAEFVALQADTFAQLVTGQIAETVGPAQGEDPITHHMKVLEGKTGSLIRTSCLVGAMIAGADDSVLAALGDYGAKIGLVFQLSDDLIDITSDTTGKTPGTDLREGIPTLPTLLLDASRDPADQELARRIHSDLSDDKTLAEVLNELRANPVIDEARRRITTIADQARATIAGLVPGAAKSALLRLCDEVVARSS